ncbi:MAG: YihY/virulence factor BrkB family protein [Ignavibacteriales bacterium]|nr:YihY/virulence factor BrkB family protein [Ignavibacteriales bacterium]
MKFTIIKFFSQSVFKIWYYAKGLYAKANDENIFFLAAGIAFNGILCLIPLLLLMTSIVGIILHSSALSLQKVDEILNAAFPPQPYAQEIKSSLMGIIDDIVRYRSTFGIYGVGILIWASASMFSSIRFVLNFIYKFKSKKLLVVTIIENIILVIILGMLFVIANFFSWILLPINSLLKTIPELSQFDISGFVKSMSYIASFLPAFIMFYIINRYIPERGISNRIALVAASTTTILWWIAGKGFALYLTAFHPYSKLYGTYTFILVFLIWIYYSSVVFVVGAMVAQLYREKNTM